MACSTDFALNVLRRHRRLGASALDQSEAARNLRNSFGFKGLLAALTIATICIFWRSVYRVAELSNGWDGPLMKRQDLFIGFEGVMIIVACLVLNVFHPSVCFKEMMDGAGGLGSSKKAKGITMDILGWDNVDKGWVVRCDTWTCLQRLCINMGYYCPFLA
jgi:hypothetical protein